MKNLKKKHYLIVFSGDNSKYECKKCKNIIQGFLS